MEETKYELVGKIKPHRGHSLFKINIETKLVYLAECDENKNVIVEEGYAYVPALNRFNALKRFLRVSQK